MCKNTNKKGKGDTERYNRRKGREKERSAVLVNTSAKKENRRERRVVKTYIEKARDTEMGKEKESDKR